MQFRTRSVGAPRSSPEALHTTTHTAWKPDWSPDLLVHACASAAAGLPPSKLGYSEEVLAIMAAMDGPGILLACAVGHLKSMFIVTSTLHLVDFLSVDPGLAVGTARRSPLFPCNPAPAS